MNEELKRCPRCGGNVVRFLPPVMSWAECAKCGFRVPVPNDVAGAIAAWNHAQTEDALLTATEAPKEPTP